jgi:hypothetical protein
LLTTLFYSLPALDQTLGAIAQGRSRISLCGACRADCRLGWPEQKFDSDPN